MKSNLKKLADQYGTLYLNENLPPIIKNLFGKANEKRKEKQYKFIWTSGCTILVRKSEKSNIIAIKKSSDLKKIE